MIYKTRHLVALQEFRHAGRLLRPNDPFEATIRDADYLTTRGKAKEIAPLTAGSPLALRRQEGPVPDLPGASTSPEIIAGPIDPAPASTEVPQVETSAPVESSPIAQESKPEDGQHEEAQAQAPAENPAAQASANSADEDQEADEVRVRGSSSSRARGRAPTQSRR